MLDTRIILTAIYKEENSYLKWNDFLGTESPHQWYLLVNYVLGFFFFSFKIECQYIRIISIVITLFHTCPVRKMLLSHLAMKTSFSTMAVLPLTFRRSARNQLRRILRTNQVGDPGRELGFDSLLDLSYGLGDNEFLLSEPSLLPIIWL